MPIVLIDDDKDEFDEAISSISENPTILFLGPLFGVSDTGSKISHDLWTYFDSSGPKVDAEYQNLFIRTSEYDYLRMAAKLKNFYNRQIPGDIYKKVAATRFSAVVNFTQDLFLNKEVDNAKVPYNFEYYGQPGDETGKPLDNKLPLIYNVYGKYDDTNSLILDYSTFYEFLFALLGNSNFFSKNMVSKISAARVFLFLGFDLKKWYVPILVTKIFSLGNHSSNRKPTSFTAVDDTDIQNEEIVHYLARYPFNFIYTARSSTFIDKLLKAQHPAGPVGVPPIRISKISTEIRDSWVTNISYASNIEVIQQLFDVIIKFGRDKNLIELVDFFAPLQTALANLHDQIINGEISDDTYRVQLRKIVRSAIKFINRY